MRRYDSYKDSGIQWLGQIPGHWEMVRNKSFMRPTEEKVGDRRDEFVLLSLTKQGVIVRDLSERKGKFPTDYNTYLVVRPSNLVFCLFDIDETPRTVGLVNNTGMLTGAYSNFEFYNDIVLPEFAYYFYLKVDDVKGLRPYYTGLRKVVKTNTFLQLRIPIPPRAEQKAIVTYLDRETEKIDSFISSKEKEIRLLEELKQAEIANVVTRGLHPNVPMKDSGIAWLGQVPEHWEIKSLRSFIRLFTEKGYGDAQLLSVTREQGVIVRNKDDKEENHNFVPEDLSGYKHILPGDFVINKMKSWQGSYGVSAYDGIVSPAYFTCKLANVEKDYFSLAIRSKAYIPFFTQYSKGIRVGQWDLDPIALMKIPFILPPIDEQKEIIEYINRKCANIDKMISNIEQEITQLKEYKQRLIADAVTGQIKVC